MNSERDIIGHCIYCGQMMVDGADISGWDPTRNPDQPYDLMTIDGDFGCDDSPDTSDDGVGDHQLDPFAPSYNPPQWQSPHATTHAAWSQR